MVNGLEWGGATPILIEMTINKDRGSEDGGLRSGPALLWQAEGGNIPPDAGPW